MDRKRVMLIAVCSALVGSGMFHALRRERVEVDSPSRIARVEVPESRFAPRQRPINGVNAAREFSDAIADAVEKVMPSVVVIRTENVKLKRERYALDPFGMYQGYRNVREELTGEGSGVIIDERGYVLTSWHVIENAVGGEVVLNDGRKMAATLVGHDKTTDLAVLKIKDGGTDCPAVEFADSDLVRVGSVAIAIGSPFSLQGSVTVGHVSQKGRKVRILHYEDFIQTDAAINEGNSGGPLIDADGRLIGVNTAKKTDDQQKAVGIAFAVPSNLAMVVARSIIETGVHEWPWVGASFYTIEKRLRKEMYDGAGVIISQVWNDTPAARAGLEPGTAVRAVDGVVVESVEDLERVIFRKSVGESVLFSLDGKDKKRLEVELLLEHYPGLTGN